MQVQETPAQLVTEGRIASGIFRTPFRVVNLLDAQLISRVGGRLFRDFRLKEWVGFGIAHPDLFGGIIIQNAKYLGSATVYLYDRGQDRMYDWNLAVAPWQAKLPETLWHSQSSCRRGHASLVFDHNLDAGTHTIRSTMPARKNMPALQVALVGHQDPNTVDPLVVSLPIGTRHHTYTTKAPLRLAGTIQIGKRVYEFRPDRDFANLDEQKTFYPYRAGWKWGGFVCNDATGTQIMLNFVNQMTHADEQGEDALWINGKLELMPQPEIRQLDDKRWSVKTADGSMDLVFTRDGSKRENLNLGLVAMQYSQDFGTYCGAVRDRSGAAYSIENAYGPLEHMRARF